MPYLQTQYVTSRRHGPMWSLCCMSIIGTGSRLEDYMTLNLQTLTSPTQVSRYWASLSYLSRPPASSFSIFSSRGLGVNGLVVFVAWNPPNRYKVSCWLPWWKCCCLSGTPSSGGVWNWVLGSCIYLFITSGISTVQENSTGKQLCQ